MTKSGAEKKRVRRAATHNGTRDPNDTPPKKQSTGKDVFQLFADKVRDHKDFESRWAVLQETRIEYFRGKDFVGFLRSHPELKDVLGSDTGFEVEDIANTLLRKNLLVRCDRVVKTVRPGKKKLSTWPAHLEIFPGAVMAESIFGFDQSFGRFVYSSIADSGCTSILVLMDQVFSENDAFFAWTFVKRRPLWQTVLSFLWPVATLAICLFPVFPHQLKLIVLYSCAGILLLIMSLLLVRSVIFGALWIILGKRVWFFPNILAEEATLSELFQFWPTKDEGERPKWTARLTYAIGAVLVILLLRHHAPDEAARARYHKRVSNIIDDVLEWSPRLALSGMMEKQPTVVNETQNNHSGDGSKTAAEEVTVSEDTNVDSSSGGHVSDDSGDEGSDNHI